MLRPVRMTLASVMLLKEDEAAAVGILAKMECLQAEHARLHKEAQSLSAMETHAAAAALEGLRSRMDHVAGELNVGGGWEEEGEVRVDPRRIAAVLEEEFAPLEKEVAVLTERVEAGEKARDKADLVSWTVAGLVNAGLDVDTIIGAEYSAIELGALPSASFARVEESLGLAGHKLFSLGRLGDRTLVCAATKPERRQELGDGLDAARFDRIVVGKDLLFDGRPAADINEEAMWEVRESLTEAGLELGELAKARGAQMGKWRREVEVNIGLLESMESFLEGSYTCLVSGWVPSEKTAALAAALEAGCKGPVEVFELGEGVVETEHEKLEPPTLLRNRGLVRPFEALVTFYGSPSYEGIDPTTFIAFTFALLFGAMFGDAGQGLVLALAGLAIRRYARRGGALADAGAIIACCGATSVLFGLIYGSIFGFEFEHLSLFGLRWKTIAPMANPAAFLAGGVLVGVLVINLGLIINVAQHVWAGKYKEAVFGEWGGTTLLFYWGVVGLFYLSVSGRGDLLTPWFITGILGPPLVATTFGSEVCDWITGKRGEHEMAGLFVRPMELMMGSLSNTMSFMRVSAFAMNHAALMGTVFVFASMLGGPKPSGVDKVVWWADVIVGNIMVMCLEGVMVFVQVLRLHYYEFFSKFFHHQGRPFEPLSLMVRRSGL